GGAPGALSADGVASVTRRDLFNWNRRAFPTVEEMDPAVALLVDHYYLCLPPEPSGLPGRGHKSPTYLVSPKALAAAEADPRAHCAHAPGSNGSANGEAIAHPGGGDRP